MPELLTLLPTLAYIGPGGALSFAGSALALLAAVVLAFFGFIWYPLKRVMKWRRRHVDSAELAEESASSEPTGS